MQNANNKKQEEKDMTVIKREEYKYTPKEGFIIAHFLTVEDVNDRQSSIFEFSEGKLSAGVNPPLSKLSTAGSF
ncbi:MAG: hypothetical protein WA421_06390 [Nitrososphaeraceae archaeon]